MMYTITIDRRRTDININHIIQMERRRNAPTLAKERISIDMIGDIKHRFRGQEAKDFFKDYRLIILPALGGVIN